jgi:protein-disulfide isomerase
MVTSIDGMRKKWFELASPVGAAEHSLGALLAPVTLVEYGDFECPNCKQAAPAVKMLLARFAGRVRFVWRHFPLEEVHPHALHAALASEVAGAQGKFWRMHDLLFNDQSHLKPAQLRLGAEVLELDMIRYDVEMGNVAHLHRVRRDVESGAASGVRATPTFFVNDVLQDASYGMQPLFDRVGKVLAK